MTLAQIRNELSDLGISILKSGIRTSAGDEWRVNFRGGEEATAYYTDDLDDAYKTGKHMAAERLSRPKTVERLVQDPRVDARIQEKIQACAQERVNEFHNRLKRNVQQLVCDVEKDDQEFANYLATLTDHPATLVELSMILRRELLQVVRAVECAK